MRHRSPESLKHRLYQFLGFTHVGLDEVLVVYRNQKIAGYLGHGYHRPRFWNETFGERVSTALRVLSVEDVEIRTADPDPIPVTVSLEVRFRFDPRESDNPTRLHRPIRLSARNFNRRVIEPQIRNAVREACANYKEVKLSNGSYWNKLAREIRIALHKKVGPLGVVLSRETAVAITQVAPPPAIEQARQAAHRRNIYAQSVGDLPERLAQNLHSQELAHHSQRLDMTVVEGLSPVSWAALPANTNRERKSRQPLPQNGNYAANRGGD